MSGIGEILVAVEVPDFWLVLVNPALEVKTARIFATLKVRDGAPMSALHWDGFDGFVGFLRAQRNDLQQTAIAIAPVIGEVLTVLQHQSGCAVARMSGSGATCFAVFEHQIAAERASAAISDAFPGWWVKATGRV